MKVFNLACEREHRFEGWFASSDDYEEQLARDLLRCPVCDTAAVRKLLSAPRLQLGHARASENAESSSPDSTRPAVPASGTSGPGAAKGRRGISAGSPERGEDAVSIGLPTPTAEKILEALRVLVTNTEDVGTRFAEEARKMHYNEAEARNIRGVTTQEERADLEDEGIPFVSLPWSGPPEGPLQ